MGARLVRPVVATTGLTSLLYGAAAADGAAGSVLAPGMLDSIPFARLPFGAADGAVGSVLAPGMLDSIPFARLPFGAADGAAGSARSCYDNLSHLLQG